MLFYVLKVSSTNLIRTSAFTLHAYLSHTPFCLGTLTSERPGFSPRRVFISFTIGLMIGHGIHWVESLVVPFIQVRPVDYNLVLCSIHLYKINTILLIPDFSFYSLPLYLSLTLSLSPGLMVTSAGIYHVLHALNVTIEIRNVCVFLAPLFSSLTVIATYHLTKELKVCTCTYMY